jgi:methylglutamate dehydrogenase subunit D
MAEFIWKSPLHGILSGDHRRTGETSGVDITELRRSLYSLSPRKGRHEEVNAIIKERLQLAIPEAGRFNIYGEMSLLWSGFNQWMLAGPSAGPGPSFGELRDALQGRAALVDHSDARAIVRISGPGARRTLARLCAVDLHPRSFEPGHCAATRMAHIGALLHQVDTTPTYEIHVFRAFAASFHHELIEAAADSA